MIRNNKLIVRKLKVLTSKPPAPREDIKMLKNTALLCIFSLSLVAQFLFTDYISKILL